MILKNLQVGFLGTNCYILGDENAGQAIVIDPGDEAYTIFNQLKSDNLTLAKILLTHAHPDHTGGAVQLSTLTNAPIFFNQEDKALFKVDSSSNLSDGEIIPLGSLNIKVIHTPGHTPGSVCFLCDNILFTGDTLFAGSVGRTDLPGGNLNALRKSLSEIKTLPPELQVLPGHGETSKMEWELESNPFLHGAL